ncbi:uncharacterized protein TrAtP1_007101 [Trichoderma atroviride]|uniref:uncharacterized protein n=1 Tax=Hypocrea atroviridis TaxID=63577 RepID=UPI003331B8F1|nr:hypothetical protein TrAtP1_007101 [Trichoderma atroviride]
MHQSEAFDFQLLGATEANLADSVFINMNSSLDYTQLGSAACRLSAASGRASVRVGGSDRGSATHLYQRMFPGTDGIEVAS